LEANPDRLQIVNKDKRARTSIVIPSTGRPGQLRKSIEQLQTTLNGHDVEIITVIECDPDSVKAVEGLGVKVLSRDEHKGPVYGWNEGAAIATGDYLVMAADDLTWGKNWLDESFKALDSIGGSGVVGFNDLSKGGDLGTHYLVSRDYAIDKWGGVLAVPHYKHYWLDVEATARAKQDRRYIWAENAVVEHRHHLWGKAKEDATYKRGDGMMKIDGKTYKKRQRKRFPIDYEPAFA
jgi:GT2 family glycosyltransferase